MRMRHVAVIAMLVLALGACGNGEEVKDTGAQGVPGRSESIIIATGEARLPAESLEDWVTYADIVLEVTVVGESEIEPAPEERERGEGLILRRLTLSADRVLWQRTELAEPPAEIEILAEGWAFEGEERTPMGTEAGRMEVGGSYVLPLALYDDEGWQPLDAAAWLDASGATIGSSDSPSANAGDVPDKADTGVVAALSGLTVSEAADLLANTAPDPAVLPYDDLDPISRWEAVSRG